jgi:citrate lyase subunit beta/citryl-CoA lyase
MTNRSYLFVPGNRPDRFDKARLSGADVTILDLEDSVSEEDKVTARENVSDWLSSDSSDYPVYVRINALSTSWFDDDLKAIVRPGLAGVLLPKAERPSDIEAVASRVESTVSIVPIIETALGLWNVGEVAASSQVERIAFGSLDLQLDLGIEHGSEELLYARSRLVTASRAMRILPPIDGVTVSLDDPESLTAEVNRARRFGFGGKLCIHPKQVDKVNRSFAPTEAEITWAKRVLEAAKNTGGAIQLDGEMIDRPVIDKAKSIFSRAVRTSE